MSPYLDPRLPAPRPLPARVDVLIVGARVAGAATAMLLARAGLSVLAVDRAAYGDDALSTHGLMRGAVMQLSRWGVLPALLACGTPPVRRSTFIYGDTEVPVIIRPEHGVDHLLAPRRFLLDRVLADAAMQAGADLRFGTAFEDVIRDPSGRVTGAVLRRGAERAEVRAGLVIGADGVRSAVARAVEAPTERQARHALAVLFGYFEGIEDRGFRWHFGTGGAAGALPTTGPAHCVFAGRPAGEGRPFGPDAEAGFAAVLAETAPGLAEETRAARRDGKLRVFAGLPGFLRRPFGPGWALVGDAGYFKDPCTAHGITDALRDAELLARAVLAGTPAAFADYHDLRDALSAPLLDVTDAIAACDWTLDEVAALHLRLSEAMRSECAVMARGAAREAPARAA